jgi:hypothetical protein
MPRVGFEPTISVFYGTKTFHALDRTATVIGKKYLLLIANVVCINEIRNWYIIMIKRITLRQSGEVMLNYTLQEWLRWLQPHTETLLPTP